MCVVHTFPNKIANKGNQCQIYCRPIKSLKPLFLSKRKQDVIICLFIFHKL